MASYPCCCGVTTCEECGVNGLAVEVVISGIGTFTLSAFSGGDDYCISTYEAEGSVCSDFDITIIGAQPGNPFLFPAGWGLTIATPGVGTQLAVIGQFNDCADLLSEAGVLHSSVAITGCGTRDITITLLP